MRRDKSSRKVVAIVAVSVVVGGWWWASRARLSGSPPSPRAAIAVPTTGGLAAGGLAAGGTEEVDPATTRRASVDAAGASTAAVGFTRALFSVPPGAGSAAVVARCRALVTPGFLAQLSSSPGAPAMASLAAPVVVTGVSAAVDDWSAAAAGVAVGVVLHVKDGQASFFGLDVHLVAVDGAWLVDGMQS